MFHDDHPAIEWLRTSILAHPMPEQGGHLSTHNLILAIVRYCAQGESHFLQKVMGILSCFIFQKLFIMKPKNTTSINRIENTSKILSILTKASAAALCLEIWSGIFPL
jgi:hypothetical protein